MLRSVLPLLACLSPTVLFVTETSEGHWEDYKYGRPAPKPHEPCSWKCLLFTLQWPGAFCQSLDRESLCKIPAGINDWTIHGLWPVKVMKCCNCWPMFTSDVQELQGDLEEHWPSLLETTSSFQFWRAEWEKHGVCAGCVEGMNSPLKYFNICLKLRGQFDLHRVLEAAGITPSCERPYKVTEVHSVLTPLIGDQYEIQCITDDEDREVWFQVKIPLTQNLTSGCHHHGDSDDHQLARLSSPAHPCPAQIPFYFLPINHQQPRHPCN
ncbi:ribonuclease T2-like [Aulostomus maculatus]